ncbi:hypothetical protein H2200_000288 [Cladophialophora chaetospira]|uniref:Extracellular serine-rich protein n=1 Tax=Cladophialophora chaetospira TaxID=386627 RepID=A0AA39CP19_9EURO|nr:hypothetical protein H2200_000288 [Cladophialophora chaetospira]
MHSILSTLAVGVLATSVLASPQYGDDSSSSMTMTMSASSSSASGVHSVKVGPGLVFTPDTVTAAEGDWVEFTFGSGHSVAQSSFDAPCVPISGGMGVFSGFPNQGDIWRIQINSTDPLWLYCSTSGHCEGGMALVVNQPSSDKTLDAYKSAAANAQGSSPQTPQGGVFGAATDSSPTSSASGSSTASATSSASGASDTGNAGTSTVVSNGMMVLGGLAAAVAAML